MDTPQISPCPGQLSWGLKGQEWMVLGILLVLWKKKSMLHFNYTRLDRYFCLWLIQKRDL